MRNIILFGNVPLATWVAERIIKARHINLIGVVCDRYDEDHFSAHGMKEPSLYTFCIKKCIKIFTFEEALNEANKQDILGISVRYHKLFKEDYYAAFKPGIINLHGGELPRFRGANIANYAILERVDRGGGTLHFISKGIDEGDIVERSFFETTPDETAHSFFTKTLDALKIAFEEFIQKIDTPGYREIQRTPQDVYVENGEIARTYYKAGIEKYREINFSPELNWDELYNKVKAFHFPNHSGAFLVSGEQKIELKLHE